MVILTRYREEELVGSCMVLVDIIQLLEAVYNVEYLSNNTGHTQAYKIHTHGYKTSNGQTFYDKINPESLPKT